jgi:hypothetical protein
LKSVVKTLGNTSPFVVKVFARDTGLWPIGMLTEWQAIRIIGRS